MEAGDIDDDAKRTVILNLHSDPNVAQLLLQRCGMSSKMAHWQRSQDPVPPSTTLRLFASLHPQRGRTPGQRPRHLLHDRRRLPDTGAFRRMESERHPSVAGNWVQRRHHRKRLVDVGSPARRTPPAETKQQKGYLNQRELAECRATARVACVQATAATASSPHEFVRTPHVHGCWPATA